MTPLPATNITLPQPWSRPWLPFSSTRRPNSLMVTSVTLSAWSTQVAEERRDRGRQVVGVAEHPAAGEVTEVDVHVPVALVDGDHLGADVAPDDPGGRREAPCRGPTRRRRRCCRPARRPGRCPGWPAGWTARRYPWGSGRGPTGCAASGVAARGSVSHWSSAAIVASSSEPMVISGTGPDSSVGGVPFTMPTPWSGEPSDPVRPAGSASRPGRWSPGRRPRPPPSRRSASGWPCSGRWRGRRPALPAFHIGSSGASFGCSPKRPSVVPASSWSCGTAIVGRAE